MSDYTKLTDFAAKDDLPSGDADKVIKGSEFETEFDNIATAIATKADLASPSFTGNVTFDNDTLVIDSANNRVGIDTASPQSSLHISSSSGEGLRIQNTVSGSVGGGYISSYTQDGTRTAFIGNSSSSSNKLMFKNEANNINEYTVVASQEHHHIVDTTIITKTTNTGFNIASGSLQIAGTAVTSTPAELNILDGATVSTAEINLLDGVTATTAELNYVDGVTSNIQTQLDAKAPTASPTFTGTATFATLSDGTINIAGFVDEDNMSSDSATLIPTQQSVKAYVDAQNTAQNLDITSDSGTVSIDLASETLTVAGGTGINSSATGNTVTVGIDATVATLTGTQTLTNKTLTSPDVNGGTIDNAVIGATTAAAGSFTTVSATGNITVSGTVDGRDIAADGTKLDGIEASADVTDTANVTAAGAVMDSELTSEASVKALNQGVSTTDSPSFAGLTVDTNTLKVDSTNNRVGILNASPDVSLDIGSATDAIHVPAGTTAERPSSPASGYFRYNTTSNQFEGYTTEWGAIAGAGSESGAADLVIDTMTGDGSTTTLNLTNAVDNENNTQVYIDGVYQNKSTYSVSTNTLTFSTAPPTGSEVEVMSIEPATINTPADGSVTSSKLSGDLVLPGDLSFGDSNKAIFGAGSDLQIYHDGSHSYIKDGGTGDLRVIAENFEVRNPNNNKVGIKAVPAAQVELYYDNTARLATSSTGIDVTGSISTDGLTVDGAVDINSSVDISGNLNMSGSGLIRTTDGTAALPGIRIGTDNDNGLYRPASNTIGFSTAAKDRMRIDGVGDISFYNNAGTSQDLFWDASTSRLGLGTTSPNADGLHIFPTGDSTNPALQIGGASTYRLGMYVSGETGHIENRNGDDGIAFHVKTAGEAMRIDGISGNVGIGTTSPAHKLSVFEDSNANRTEIGIDNTDQRLVLGAYFESGVAQYATIQSTNNAETTAQNLVLQPDGGNVGIGTDSPANLMHLEGSQVAVGATQLTLEGSYNGYGAGLEFVSRTSSGGTRATMAKITADGEAAWNTTASTQDAGLRFSTTEDGTLAERMRITSAGSIQIPNQDAINELEFTGTEYTNIYSATTSGMDVGTTGSGYLRLLTNNTERMRIDSSGNLLVGKTANDNTTAGFKVQSGGFFSAVANGTTTCVLNRLTSDGDIAIFRKDGSTVGSIGTSSSSLYIGKSSGAGLMFQGGNIIPVTDGSAADDTYDLGASGVRFDDIYATNGTIQTSDRNEKQDIEELSEAEQRVAVACKGLLRKFRWKDAVEEKGDDARIHFGIIAQDLQDAFTAEGLDAGRYAMFINTTWTDEETGEERSRMGVRYSELLAFIISAI